MPAKLLKSSTYPNFPRFMKAELVGPNTNHTPSVKEDDTEGNRVEHGLGS